MRLSVFIKHQNNSDRPIMCMNKEHEMPLVPMVNNTLSIELKCFVPGCNYTILPGFLTYQELLDKQNNA
jgi:hypothetical protein